MSQASQLGRMTTEALVIAWDRGEAGLTSLADIAGRYSRQHVVSPPEAARTLCGASWPVAHQSAGDTRRCRRCFALAAARDLTDQHGEPIR